MKESELDLYWKENYNKIIDFIVNNDINYIVSLLYNENEDIDLIESFLDSTPKHQAIEMLYILGDEIKKYIK